MKVKIGDWVFGKVVEFSEYGVVVQLEDGEKVYARSSESLKLGEEVQMQFKSYGVGCYWEAECNGL